MGVKKTCRAGKVVHETPSLGPEKAAWLHCPPSGHGDPVAGAGSLPQVDAGGVGCDYHRGAERKAKNLCTPGAPAAAKSRDCWWVLQRKPCFQARWECAPEHNQRP